MIQKLFDLLASKRRVFIIQKKEVTELLVNWETQNRYEFRDVENNFLGTIEEDHVGFSSTLTRQFFGSHRPLHVSVKDNLGTLLLEFRRPFFWFLSKMEVQTAEGHYLGRINRRFRLFSTLYDLEDTKGRIFAQIKKPLWKFWEFRVESSDGRSAGRISKKWSGVFSEAFTDADRFGVEFVHGAFSGPERALVFSAAISIDFDFFENNHRN